MSKRPNLIRRSFLPIAISVLAGLALGVAVSGFPDREALNPLAGRPPLTVKEGALIDLSELTVPPLALPSSSPPPVATSPDSSVPDSSASTSTTSLVEPDPATELSIMVANGNGTAGTASKWAGELVTLGYLEPQVGNTNQTVSWVVYYAEGFAEDATRLAKELSSVPGAASVVIATLDKAPNTQPGFEGHLLVVIGTATR